jgi:exopolyphosphatase/guanosine-5'-triphosphate,3'-diphosphate pyrophosphatase
VNADTGAAGADGLPPGIVPRWEWRTFGDHLGPADDLLSAREPELVEESDELYLLSEDSDASVKVRNGLMDVKQLEAVNADGLEQWRPTLKKACPLDAQDVSTVLTALGAAPDGIDSESYPLDELLNELVKPNPSLTAVEVHKRRAHYHVDGCMAEVTELSVGGRSARSVAVEDEDPELVSAVLRELSLADLPNVCAARGLKTLVGFDPVRFAVIDVGTNSVKLLVGERRAGDAWRTIVDRAEVTRLGEGLRESGTLQPEPVRRTAEAIVGMVGEARRAGAAEIAAVATAGMRIASNSEELFDAVQKRSGVGIEVISGEEEARLSYRAATSELEVGVGTLAVFDTGGGSTEFTFGRAGRVEERFSVDVGAARYTERFGLDGVVSEELVRTACDAMSADLERLGGRSRPDVLIGMGGALTNLASVQHGLETYDSDVIHGTILDRAEIERQVTLYSTRTADERREIVGLQPGRAEVILAGACIVRTVLDRLLCDELTVSDRGLRHGLILERFSAAPRP